MKKTTVALATFVLMASGAAVAQDFQAGTVLVRARAVHLDSANKDSTGLNLSIDNKTLPEVDFTWFFSPNLAAELVLPKKPGATAEPLQFARSPYVAGFRAGWAYLTLLTAHIYYGKSVAVDPRRLQEITDFAQTVAKNAEKYSTAPQYEPGKVSDAGNLIMLGDFNIFNREDITLQAITDAGFVVPPELLQLPGSNVARNKHYDQIAYHRKLSKMRTTGRAGIFDFYEHVYRDEAAYAGPRNGRGSSFNEWRTYQMSDHLPMWIEFSVDDSEAYLDSLG